jgi:hypothetical protein
MRIADREMLVASAYILGLWQLMEEVAYRHGGLHEVVIGSPNQLFRVRSNLSRAWRFGDKGLATLLGEQGVFAQFPLYNIMASKLILTQEIDFNLN